MNKFAGLLQLLLIASVTAQQVIVPEEERSLVYPGDNCCTVYDLINFRGTKKKFCLNEGKAGIVFNMTDYGFADKIESYYCGKSV